MTNWNSAQCVLKKADAEMVRAHRYVWPIGRGECRHWTGKQFRVWKSHTNEAMRLYNKAYRMTSCRAS